MEINVLALRIMEFLPTSSSFAGLSHVPKFPESERKVGKNILFQQQSVYSYKELPFKES